MNHSTTSLRNSVSVRIKAVPRVKCCQLFSEFGCSLFLALFQIYDDSKAQATISVCAVGEERGYQKKGADEEGHRERRVEGEDGSSKEGRKRGDV